MLNIIEEISKENPTGSDYKYEDAYIAIEMEIDKTMNAAANMVDWKFVRESSESILVEHSKDLKIASYWLYAHWKLNSVESLESLLPSYQALIEQYGSELFPKSVKVKLRILEWLQESLTQPLLQVLPSLEEARVEALIVSFETLEKSILKAFDNEELRVFASLIRKLKKMLDERNNLKKLNVSEEEEKEKEDEKKSEEEISLPTPDIPSQTYDIKNHLKLIEEQISHLNYENHEAFSVSQVVGLLVLEEAFNQKEPLKRTLFPTIDEVKKLEQIKDEKVYLEELKVLIMNYPSWLEGWHQLLIKIDNPNELKYKLINFIDKNEKKLDIYAPKEYVVLTTDLKKWINLEKKFFMFSNENAVYEEEYAHALALFEDKNKEEAIKLLDTLQQNSKSDKESFLWRLKQAYLALKIGNKNMAVALLYELDRDIEAFNLMKWNPKLATEVYVLILNPSITKILNLESKESFYRKLCRLSPKDANNISFL